MIEHFLIGLLLGVLLTVTWKSWTAVLKTLVKGKKNHA